jgi:hypothetical protein
MCDNVCVTIGLWWDDEDAEHIRRGSLRYPGAVDIDPAWTLEAAADPHRVTRDPDPKSWAGDIRVIGYSASAGFVITVMIRSDNHSGATARRTSGADLRAYREGREGSE